MQIFLIGHRGAGKSSVLQRFQIYGRGGFPVFDLDREIEKKTGLAVGEILDTQGEALLRTLEKSTLDELVAKNPKMVCALGAGFPLDSYVFQPKVEILWIRRSSDAPGFQQRNLLFSKHADWVYFLPEGLVSPCEFERKILGSRLNEAGGILTLRPDHFRNPQVFRDRIASMGVDFFELRNDLLNEAELGMARGYIPPARLLVSVRSLPFHEEWREVAASAAHVDWPLELGEVSPIPTSLVSLHERASEETLPAMVGRLAGFEAQGKNVKWSPVIETFSEIDFGFRWQQENPEKRSFLPRSSTGRWAWARLLLKERQKFNFFRDGDGSAIDQPTLHEWIRSVARQPTFGAVLGHPVDHSYSPIEHLEFAQQRQLNFFAIDLQSENWNEALPLLEAWGLQLAAVTAPLKKAAYGFASQRSPEAQELQSANTLLRLTSGEWRAHNTDLTGFAEMTAGSGDLGSTVLWGGGGTLPVLEKIIPAAQAVSVRTGQPRDETQDLMAAPDTLVWAAAADAPLPPSTWKPHLILDLNYRDDSRAREYADRVGARYVAGLVMFRAQAAAQRAEWESHGI